MTSPKATNNEIVNSLLIGVSTDWNVLPSANSEPVLISVGGSVKVESGDSVETASSSLL